MQSQSVLWSRRRSSLFIVELGSRLVSVLPDIAVHFLDKNGDFCNVLRGIIRDTQATKSKKGFPLHMEGGVILVWCRHLNREDHQQHSTRENKVRSNCESTSVTTNPFSKELLSEWRRNVTCLYRLTWSANNNTRRVWIIISTVAKLNKVFAREKAIIISGIACCFTPALHHSLSSGFFLVGKRRARIGCFLVVA